LGGQATGHVFLVEYSRTRAGKMFLTIFFACSLVAFELMALYFLCKGAKQFPLMNGN